MDLGLGKAGAKPKLYNPRDHIGVDSEPPHISPARGPPLWKECGDAQMGKGVQIEPAYATDWDGAAQLTLDFEVDQRIGW